MLWQKRWDDDLMTMEPTSPATQHIIPKVDDLIENRMEFLLINLKGHSQGKGASLQVVVCTLTGGVGEPIATVVSKVSDFSVVKDTINHLDQPGCHGREGEL